MAHPFEVFWAIAFFVLLLTLVVDTQRRGALGTASLLSIAGLSIFWQEFYADWGAYLLWSSELRGLPWGPIPLMTPHKPAMNVISYPVFMCLAFLAMLAILRFARRRLPNVPLLSLSLFAAGPVLVLCNLGTEYISVTQLGLWTYTETYGPALRTEAGAMPLLFPNIPFAIFGAVTSWLIASTDVAGRPKFERLLRSSATTPAVLREAKRALSWIVVFNLSYWLFLCTPLIVGRLLFGPSSVLVP